MKISCWFCMYLFLDDEWRIEAAELDICNWKNIIFTTQILAELTSCELTEIYCKTKAIQQNLWNKYPENNHSNLLYLYLYHSYLYSITECKWWEHEYGKNIKQNIDFIGIYLSSMVPHEMIKIIPNTCNL